MLINKQCIQCGNGFKVHRYRLDTAKYCSKQCQLKSLKGKFKANGHERIMHNGYTQIRINGEYVYKHRWMMEKFLGRKLLPTEIVHHRDGNRQNNTYSNFKRMDKKKHDTIETKRRWEKGDRFFLDKEKCNQPRIGRKGKGLLCQRVKPCTYHSEVSHV